MNEELNSFNERWQLEKRSQQAENDVLKKRQNNIHVKI